MKRTRTIVSVISLVAALGSGCFHVQSPAMHAAEALQPLHASRDQALVVFVRPSAFAFAIGANLLDENGRFLGDSMAQSYFAVAVPQGRHLFTVWAENTDAIAADVVAGRIYYIEVAPTMGAFSARMHLRAIKPSQPNWPHLAEWLEKSKQLISDFVVGQANLDRRAQDVAERLRRAKERAASYAGEDLVQHTLGPDDGVAG